MRHYEITLEVRERPCPKWGQREFEARIAGGPSGFGTSPWNAIGDAIHADNSDTFGRLDWNRW